MTWETVRKGAQGTRQDRPAVSVNARGTVMNLNTKALALLGSPAHVELLYDPEAELLGVRAAGPDDPNAYHATNGQVSIQVVTKRYGFAPLPGWHEVVESGDPDILAVRFTTAEPAAT